MDGGEDEVARVVAVGDREEEQLVQLHAVHRERRRALLVIDGEATVPGHVLAELGGAQQPLHERDGTVGSLCVARCAKGGHCRPPVRHMGNGTGKHGGRAGRGASRLREVSQQREEPRYADAPILGMPSEGFIEHRATNSRVCASSRCVGLLARPSHQKSQKGGESHGAFPPRLVLNGVLALLRRITGRMRPERYE